MLLEELSSWHPKYIKQFIEATQRDTVTADRWNELWNFNIKQGDHNTEAVYKIIQILQDMQVDLINVVLGQIPNNSITFPKMGIRFATEAEVIGMFVTAPDANPHRANEELYLPESSLLARIDALETLESSFLQAYLLWLELSEYVQALPDVSGFDTRITIIENSIGYAQEG